MCSKVIRVCHEQAVACRSAEFAVYFSLEGSMSVLWLTSRCRCQYDDIVMDDESIPGLDDIADAIGDTEDEDTSNADVLPFGMGAKAEVIQSSLPFGVGSFSDSVTEVAIPIGEQDYEEDSVVEEPVVTEQNVEEY